MDLRGTGNMKKKIRIYIFAVTIILLCVYEGYHIVKYNGNMIIRVFNCSQKKPLLKFDLYIDGKIRLKSSVENITCHEWTHSSNYVLPCGHTIELVNRETREVIFSDSFYMFFFRVIDITYFDDNNVGYMTFMRMPEIL